jgi:hypothetical protein
MNQKGNAWLHSGTGNDLNVLKLYPSLNLSSAINSGNFTSYVLGLVLVIDILSLADLRDQHVVFENVLISVYLL